jgi:hypothetical protein
MSDYDDEPTPELQPTDCTGNEDCPAGWHVHGCYEDGGGCTDPHEHVIAAGPSTPDRLRRQLAASLPLATPAQVDNLMETARQLGAAIRDGDRP